MLYPNPPPRKVHPYSKVRNTNMIIWLLYSYVACRETSRFFFKAPFYVMNLTARGKTYSTMLPLCPYQPQQYCNVDLKNWSAPNINISDEKLQYLTRLQLLELADNSNNKSTVKWYMKTVHMLKKNMVVF